MKERRGLSVEDELHFDTLRAFQQRLAAFTLIHGKMSIEMVEIEARDKIGPKANISIAFYNNIVELRVDAPQTRTRRLVS